MDTTSIIITTSPIPTNWISTMRDHMQVYPDADSPQDQASRVINYLNPSRLTFEDGRAKLEFHEVVNGYYNDDVQELLAIFRDEAIGYRCFDGGTLESDPCVAFWHPGMTHAEVLLTDENRAVLVHAEKVAAILQDNVKSLTNVMNALHLDDYEQAVAGPSIGLE